VILARAARLNAFDEEMIAELTGIFRSLSSAPDIRCVVLAACEKPTLAAVNGDAYGGGVGLIAAADIAVSVSSARFAISEARSGILPAVISPYLVRAIGARSAQRLALTTELFSASEAFGLGLIHEVVASDHLDAAVNRFTDRLLQSGPAALREIKTLYRRLEGAPIDSELREPDGAHERAGSSDRRGARRLRGVSRQAFGLVDRGMSQLPICCRGRGREGLNALREQRPPQF
jgi:enoyl-CoA hydratase/carnithine racemase